MRAGSAARQAPVDDAGDPRKIPADVLRFAALPEDKRTLLIHVSELLEEIAFGTVVIVQQDGKVIQIETSEKIRLR
jgi:hypothetical protein